MTDEDRQGDQIFIVLHRLRENNPAWGKNYRVFCDMTPERQTIWWTQAQKQAALGVPAMQELVNAVILLRLTS